jgi:molecular chaperone GrpE
MKGKEHRTRGREGANGPPEPDDSDSTAKWEDATGLDGNPGEEILISPVAESPVPQGQAEEVVGSAIPTSSKESEYLEDLRRLGAEFANYRRRVQREKAEWEVRAKADLITTLLPVLDDLAIAREYWAGRQVGKDAEGLLMILTRLEDLLRSSGIEVQNTEPGTLFDPNRHEALAMGPSDQYPEGTILETLQRGYVYRDLLLRPARVRVSQGPADEAP